MSYYDGNDPNRRDSPYDLNAGRDGGAWAWIAGAALVAILVALAVGMHHAPNQNVALNNPPALSSPAAPPSGPASPKFTPAPTNPIAPAPPAKP